MNKAVSTRNVIKDSRSFFQTLQDEVNDNQSGYSAKELADWLGKSYSTFMNELNPDIETHKLGVSSWRKLISRMGGSKTIHLICEENGGIFVDLTEIEGGAAVLQKNLADLLQETSNTVREYSQATSPDSAGGADISKKEALALAKRCNQLLVAVELFKRTVLATAGGLE